MKTSRFGNNGSSLTDDSLMLLNAMMDGTVERITIRLKSKGRKTDDLGKQQNILIQ